MNQGNALTFLVRSLASNLGRVVARQEGDAALELVEGARRLARDFRRNAEPARLEELSVLVAGLDQPQLVILIKAFTHYFGMANLAEKLDAHRGPGSHARRQRAAQLAQAPEGARHTAPHDLRKDFFAETLIMPVFTAHPTESKRRTTLKILHRLTTQAEGLLEEGLGEEELEARRLSVLQELVILWQSDEVRRDRPSVLTEARRNLFYFEGSLAEAVPKLYRHWERDLSAVYGEDQAFHLPPFTVFGSWIGGDRDGNPFVTAKVSAGVISEMRSTALRLHTRALTEAYRRLSLSEQQVEISLALAASLRDDQQPPAGPGRAPERRHRGRTLPPEAALHARKAAAHRPARTARPAGAAEPPARLGHLVRQPQRIAERAGPAGREPAGPQRQHCGRRLPGRRPAPGGGLRPATGPPGPAPAQRPSTRRP